jgi:hypothetical protein
MNGQEDQIRETRRSNRKYQPILDQPLESREVPAVVGSPASAAVSASSAMTRQPLRQTSANSMNWSSMEGLSWLTGVWRSKTQITFLGSIAQTLGRQAGNIPSIPSLDTWFVGENQYIGRSVLAAQQQTVMPVDGIIIRPGVNPTLAMTTADGSEPVELAMVSSNRNSMTFMGMSQQVNSVTNADGTTTNQVTDFAPVRVTFTTRNQRSLRITAELQSSKSWIRLFSYTANKTDYQVG